MWTIKGYDIGCSSFRQRHSVWIDCSKGNHFILCIKNYLYYDMSTINYHKDFIHLFMNWHLFSDLLSSSSIRTTMLSNIEQVKAEAGNCDWFVLCYSLGISAVMVFPPFFRIATMTYASCSTVWVGAHINWGSTESWSISWVRNWEQSKGVHECRSAGSRWNRDSCILWIHLLVWCFPLPFFSASENKHFHLQMVTARLSHEDAKTKGWLLDGYPRSFAQAQSLENLKIRPDVYVVLDVCACKSSF